MVADPHIVGPIDRPWTMVPYNTCPGGYKHAALELYKRSFPRVASSPILQADAQVGVGLRYISTGQFEKRTAGNGLPDRQNK